MAGENGQLGLLIQASLNMGLSLKTINEQLQALSRHPSLQKLKIQVEIDEKFVNSLLNLNKNLDQITKSLTAQSTANTDVKKTITDTTSALEKQTNSVRAATEAEKQWRLEKERIVKDGNGNQKYTTSIYGNNQYNKQQVTTLPDGSINGIIDTTNLEKIRQENEKIANQMADGRIKAAEKTQQAVEAANLKMIDSAHKEALEEEKVNQQKIKYAQDYEQFWLKSLKMQELADEASYQKRLESLKIFQERSETITKNLARRYGSSIDVSGLNSNLSTANGLDVNDPNLVNKMKQISNGFKDIEASAKTAGSNFMNMSEKFGEAMRSFPVWIAASTLVMGAIHAVINGFKEGIVDIDAKMAGYVQTNEAVLNSQQKVDQEAQKFIQTAHELGASINDVLDSARLWGRMYKDVNVVQELVQQSTKLSTIDLVSLGDATKGMEAILSQYNVQLRNVNDAQVIGNSLLDKFSKVAHDSAIPARDLLVAYERMGSAAYQTGVSVDFMNGLLSSGFRATALSGENLGNMWKTVLGNIRSNKAVSEIERLGVATKEVVNGTEQWRKAEDILLDLSVKVIGKNEDLTKSYEAIARGVFQYQKLAASLNVGNIIQGEAASLNSFGSTTEYLVTQMNTIQRKSDQVHASFLGLFNSAGNDGLRSSIKGLLDVVDQFLIGLGKIPKGAYEVTGVLGALGISVLLLSKPTANLITAIKTLSVAQTENTAKSVMQTAAIAGSTVATEAKTVVTEGATVAIGAMTAAEAASTIATAAATAGISLIVGLLVVFALNAGSAAKAQQQLTDQLQKHSAALEQEYTQIEKQIQVIPQWIKVYFDLDAALKSGTLSVEGQAKAKNALDKVSKALADTIGAEGLAQIRSAQNTDAATKIIIESLTKRKIASKQALVDSYTSEASSLDVQRKTLEQGIKQKQDQLSTEQQGTTFFSGKYGLTPRSSVISGLKDNINADKQAMEDLKKNQAELGDKLTTAQTDQFALDQLLNGASGKTQAADPATIKSNFDSKMADFRHLVNMQASGYKTASDQLSKLKGIRKEFAGQLTDTDLYGVDEEIYRAQNDIALKAKGIPNPKAHKVGPSLSDSLADPLQDQNLTKELIASYNQVYDARQKNIDSIDRQIKTAQKAKDEAQVIELTNKKIQEQTAAVKDLQTAQQKMHDLADKQRAKANNLGNQMGLKFDTEKWFDAGGNGTLEYGKFLQTLVDRSKAVHDNTKLSVKERNNELSAISKQKTEIENIFNVLQLTKQGWQKNADEVQKLFDNIDTDKLTNLQNSINSLNKTLDDYTNKFGESQKTQSLFNQGSQGYNDQVKIQIKLLAEKAQAVQDDISWTEQQLKQQGNSAEQIQILNDQLVKFKVTLLDVQKAEYDYAVSLAQNLIDIQNQIDQAVIDSYQTQIDSLQKQWDAQAITEERSKRILEISQLQSQLTIFQSSSISSISDELAKQLGLEQQKAEAVQRQNDLIKQQQLLKNIQNEKDVQIFKDGSFQWVADPRKIATETDKLKQMQDDWSKWNTSNLDTLQANLKQKQLDYANWERDQSRKATTDHLQQLMKQKQDEMKLRNDKFNEEKSAWATHGVDINDILSSTMDTLKGTYGTKWDALLTVLAGKLTTAKQMYAEMMSMVGGSGGVFAPVDIGSTSGTTITTPSGSGIFAPVPVSSSPSTPNHPTTSGKSNQQLYLEGLSKTGTGGLKIWADQQLKLKKYETGGLNTETGPVWLDGTPANPELVLKADDTKNLLTMIKSLPEILSKTNFLSTFQMKTPDFSSILKPKVGVGGNDGTQIHIANMTVKTNNAREFINNLTLLANNQY